MPKHGKGSGSGTILFLRAVVQNMLYQVKVLSHWEISRCCLVQFLVLLFYRAAGVLAKLSLRYAISRMITPPIIIGIDNCCPFVIQSKATKPRWASGSRKNSINVRKTPYPRQKAPVTANAGRGLAE